MNSVRMTFTKTLDVEQVLNTPGVKDIISSHALGAAAAGLGVAWIPGAGSSVSLAVAVTILWTMYFRINKCLGLRSSKVLLRTLASAMVSNLAQGAIVFTAGTILATLLSLTGIGGMASSVIMAALDYAVIYIGGLMYIKLLTKLMRVGQDPADMRPEDAETWVKQVLENENINAMFRQYTKEYKNGRKDGTISGNESFEELTEEEQEIA